MTFSDNITSITQDKIIPKVVDTVLNASPLTLRILGNQKSWQGVTLGIPIKYAQNDQGMFFDGLDKFNTAKVETRIKMYFSPTACNMPIVISGMERDINAGQEKVLDLIKLECASSAQDMVDNISDAFYGLQSGKSFLGLRDICDDGTSITTYGGLARATYTGLAGNITTSSGATTVAKWATMFDKCTKGADQPDYIITTASIFRTYEALCTPVFNVSTNGYAQFTRTGVATSTAALGGQQGFNALYFRGKPVVIDEKCPSGYTYFLSDKHLAFYGIKSTKYTSIGFSSSDIESSQGDLPKTTGFAWSGLQMPIDQYGEVGQIVLMGDLISDSPRHLGLLSGAT